MEEKTTAVVETTDTTEPTAGINAEPTGGVEPEDKVTAKTAPKLLAQRNELKEENQILKDRIEALERIEQDRKRNELVTKYWDDNIDKIQDYISKWLTEQEAAKLVIPEQPTNYNVVWRTPPAFVKEKSVDQISDKDLEERVKAELLSWWVNPRNLI